MRVRHIKILLPAFVFYVLLFAGLWFFTLNFNYVERDDAATILYHLAGRNPKIQPPFAAYHSGMDYLLEATGLQTEESLRVFAVSISFFSGLVVLMLLALLLELSIGDRIPEQKRRWFYMLMPILIPDFLFHSLIINTANLSFALMLGSLVLVVRYLQTANRWLLALSVVLLALAIPFRWTMLQAFPVYAGYLLYVGKPLGWVPFKKHFVPMALACMAALLLAFVFIAATGYDFSQAMQTITSGTAYLDDKERSLLAFAAGGSAFLTPGFVLLMFLGLFRFYQSRRQNQQGMAWLLLLLCALVPFFLTGFYPYFKYSMTLVPVLLLLAFEGFALLMLRWRAVVLAVVLLPWFVGIKVVADGTFCGPGFEMTPKTAQWHSNQNSGQNPDTRVHIKKAYPAFSAGFYMPMAEGPRPLYGYAYAFFGNGWKAQIQKLREERDQIYQMLSTSARTVYFQDRPCPYLACDLYRLGYTTKDAANKDGRVFTRGKDSISISIRLMPNSRDLGWMEHYFESATQAAVFRSTYSSDILKLYGRSNGSLELLGPFTLFKP